MTEICKAVRPEELCISSEALAETNNSTTGIWLCCVACRITHFVTEVDIYVSFEQQAYNIHMSVLGSEMQYRFPQMS